MKSTIDRRMNGELHTMDLGIAGKVAFVSGGSMGMGRTTAELFAREGCRVVVAALPDHKESIDDTVAAIQAAGGQAVGVAADLTKEDDVDRAVATAEDAFGSRPDIAVANFGGPKQGEFFTVTNEDFEAALHDMAMSMVYLARAVIPHMREQRWGRIVALNSGAAKEPPPELPHILANTSRAAVIPLNKSLSNEFGQDGITINTIATGYIATPRMEAYYETLAEARGVPAESLVEQLVSSVPVRRLGSPEEMAATIVFLCSQQAGYVTGQFIAVDGGFHRSAW
jgi:3-oxoacyl-[acyl-carrier protein] reductase